jgi:WD40 repeat protein
LAYGPDHEIWAALFDGGTYIFGWGGNSHRGGIQFEATAAAFPRDNKLVCLANSTGTVRIYKTPRFRDEAKEELGWKGHTSLVRCAVFSPDGDKLATGGDDKMLKVWDVKSGKELARFPHPGSVTAVVVTPDSRYAITACADGNIRVWNLMKGTASAKAP